MNDRDQVTREEFLSFLTDLGGQDELSPAERHLAIAALNLGDEHGSFQLRASLESLMVGSLLFEENLEKLLLFAGSSFPHLPVELLVSRIEEHQQRETGTFRRTPRPHKGQPSPRRDLLFQLIALEKRAGDFLATDEEHRWDLLLEDSTLLVLAAEVLTKAPDSTLGEVFKVYLSPALLAKDLKAAWAFAEFESLDFKSLPGAYANLKDRDHRFESSLATHLDRAELLPLLRLLLIVDAEGLENDRGTRHKWHRIITAFPRFAGDPTLVELFFALLEMRHRCLAYLRGALPLESLSSWVNYLRGPALDFAEIRELTLREGISFAHFTLHLLNLFDLVTGRREKISKEIRRNLLDVEEELKEFALLGQEQGVDERGASLRRFDAARWRRSGARGHLADRLARLAGSWRYETKGGLPGKAPRQEGPLVDSARQVVGLGEEKEIENRSDLDALANLLRRAEIKGYQDLEFLSPEQILTLLKVGTSQAHQESTINTDEVYCLDLKGVFAWLQGPDQPRRLQLFSTLLEETQDEPGQVAPGGAFRFVVEAQRLQVFIETNERVEALLTLLGDQQLTPGLRKELLGLLGGQAPAAPERSKMKGRDRESTQGDDRESRDELLSPG